VHHLPIESGEKPEHGLWVEIRAGRRDLGGGALAVHLIEDVFQVGDGKAAQQTHATGMAHEQTAVGERDRLRGGIAAQAVGGKERARHAVRGLQEKARLAQGREKKERADHSALDRVVLHES
jgi:hypothetical protein